MAWQKIGEQDTGNWWVNGDEGLAAFEDTEEECYYAWRLTVAYLEGDEDPSYAKSIDADHDDAIREDRQSPCLPTLEAAVAAIPA
jgi:hypothetical protein